MAQAIYEIHERTGAPSEDRAASAPWSAWAAALLSMLAVFVTSGGSAAPVLLATLLLASRTIAWRAENPTAVQFLRFIFWGGALAIHFTQQKQEVYGHWLLRSFYVLAVGQMCAAEMVVQAWRKRPSTGSLTRVMLFLSSIVLITACNTFETRYIRLIAPPYVLCLALTLLKFNPKPIGKRPVGIASAMRKLMLMLAFLIGGGIYFGFWTFRHDLTQLFMQYLQQRVSDSSGIASQPHLTSQTSLRGGLRRVLKIAGPIGEYHLRATAFDLYAQGRWGPDVDIRHYEPIEGPRFNSSAAGKTLKITRIVDDFRFLVAPLNCKGLSPEKDYAVHNSAENGGPLRTRLWPMAPYTHGVILSEEPNHQGPLCETPSEITRARCLTVPFEIRSELSSIARKVAGRLEDPIEKIHAVERYLQQNHSYSLETNLAPGDPVLSFLRDNKDGHCELFASSAVLLLRCMGVPSRYVTGYYAHEIKADGEMVVRDRDAHAWTECYIEDLGWISVDATPGAGMPSETEVSKFRRAWEWLQDFFSSLSESMEASDWTRILWIFLAVAACYFLIRFLQHLLTRKSAPEEKSALYTALDPELAALALRFDTLLRINGLSCPASTTWQEHLRGIQQRESSDKATLNLSLAETFMNQYNSVRFGKSKDTNAIAALDTLLNQMERKD